MPTNTLPIVGSFYGPQRGSPSKTLIEVLAIGTPLLLIAEPDNPADSNAIAVYVESKHFSDAAKLTLAETLPNSGFSLDQILAQDAWHLGYVPKNMAATLTAQGALGAEPYPVTFALSSSGAPRVRSEYPFDV